MSARPDNVAPVPGPSPIDHLNPKDHHRMEPQLPTCLLFGHDYTDPARPEDGTYGWRACACAGTLPAHSWGADPVDGNGCGMAWRVCRHCDHIAELPLSELADTDEHDSDPSDLDPADSAAADGADLDAEPADGVLACGSAEFDPADGYCFIHAGHCSSTDSTTEPTADPTSEPVAAMFSEVQPGGSFRQDVAAGLALPYRRMSA